jgi:hypothetical protein
MDLKERVKQFGHSRNLILKSIYVLSKPLWMIARMTYNRRYRSEVVAGLKSKKRQYQISTYTKFDRYPELFAQCKLYFQESPPPRLLSFGCSTGEEVETLKFYMPHAQITGVDSNNWCIKVCRKKFINTGYVFYNSGSRKFLKRGNFDAIFCLAVLQRIENRNNKEKKVATGFTFDLFEQEIKVLDAKLKSGGLLIIDNCDFSFMDTTTASQYFPLDFEENQILQDRPLFDRNNKKIAEETFLHRIYVKRSRDN